MHIERNIYQVQGLVLQITDDAHQYISKLAVNEIELGLSSVTVQTSCQPDLILDCTPEQDLVLNWFNDNAKKPLRFHLDFDVLMQQLKSFPAPKQGAFNQALGKKTQTVLDVTGGWGADAMLMATQGYEVHIVERNPVMALLLSEALFRLNLSSQSGQYDQRFVVPKVVHADAIDYVTEAALAVDCVYLDPMFPPKRKKSAAVNKQMQLLHVLVGQDLDADRLLNSVLSSGAKRTAVKRPDYAEPLLKTPSQQFSSKLVHYDVYLTDS